MLPKDYLRFRMTGFIHSEYSDAAGTLLLNISEKTWSKELCEIVGIDINICPPLVESNECVGTVNDEFAQKTGLSSLTKVFAGGADNACGAIDQGSYHQEKRYAVLEHLVSYFLMKSEIIENLMGKFIILIMERKMLLYDGRNIIGWP